MTQPIRIVLQISPAEDMAGEVTPITKKTLIEFFQLANAEGELTTGGTRIYFDAVEIME